MNSLPRSEILIVIEQADLRQLYHEMLLAAGFDIWMAIDAAEGLLQLVCHRVKLVLLSAALPTQAWERMLFVMGHRDDWRQIPVILLNFEGRIEQLRSRRIPEVIVPIDSQTLLPNEFLDLVGQLLTSQWSETKKYGQRNRR